MKVATYEATIENGQIKVAEGVKLPERAKVYVVIPSVEEVPLRIGSPRLADPGKAMDFVKEVAVEPLDAGI